MGDHTGHSHSHADRDANPRRLAWTLALTLVYMAAEISGGYISGSLALLADAGHMFSDAAALALSLFAAWIARRPASPRHSYGFYRAEILAALVNGSTLIAISVLIFIEAYRRFGAPEPVAGKLMAAVAAGGLVVNLVCMAILQGGKSDNLNVRGAWLHVLTDALGSGAALAAGALVWAFDWFWADPVASVLIGLLVIYSSWQLVKQAVAVLMQSAPPHIDVPAVEQAIASAPGVLAVHDLHVWTITSGMESLSAHVVVRDGDDGRATLDAVRRILHDRFAIDHITIQIESPGPPDCETSF